MTRMHQFTDSQGVERQIDIELCVSTAEQEQAKQEAEYYDLGRIDPVQSSVIDPQQPIDPVQSSVIDQIDSAVAAIAS